MEQFSFNKNKSEVKKSASSIFKNTLMGIVALGTPATLVAQEKSFIDTVPAIEVVSAINIDSLIEKARGHESGIYLETLQHIKELQENAEEYIESNAQKEFRVLNSQEGKDSLLLECKTKLPKLQEYFTKFEERKSWSEDEDLESALKNGHFTMGGKEFQEYLHKEKVADLEKYTKLLRELESGTWQAPSLESLREKWKQTYQNEVKQIPDQVEFIASELK